MSEETRENPSRGSAETENTQKKEEDEELRSELLQDVLEWLQKRIWWKRMFKHPSILSQLFSWIYHWSREQK